VQASDFRHSRFSTFHTLPPHLSSFFIQPMFLPGVEEREKSVKENEGKQVVVV